MTDHSTPTPGLQGDLSGSCIVCMRPTDTALSFRGSLEWMAAGLSLLGVPQREAIATVEAYPPPLGAFGFGTATYRVCRECAARSELVASVGEGIMPVLVVDGARVPCLSQPGVDGP